MADRTCTWPECDRKHVAQGYCPNHYQQARRRGIIDKIEIPHRLSSVDIEAGVADCSDCGAGIPILTNSLGSRCRTWAREVRRASYVKNVERRRAYHREYNRRYKFGLPRGGIEALLDEVGWACEICAKPLTVRTARLDHDHSCCTGLNGRTCGDCLRGVLCNACNAGIGMLGEDPAMFASALAYLARSK